jgi:outer membrane receptor for monomeric catechols
MATYSSNISIAWGGPFQTRSTSPITFTVPTGQFFKGKISVRGTIAAPWNYKAGFTASIQLTNSGGNYIFSDSALAYTASANDGVGFDFGGSFEVELGAGTYYFSAVNIHTFTAAQYMITGQLYYNTPA